MTKNPWNLKVALSKIYILIVTLSTHDKLVHSFTWFQTIQFNFVFSLFEMGVLPVAQADLELIV